MLQEFGVAKKLDFIELSDFCRIIYPEHDFVVDFNREHFLQFLNNNFSQERENISRLFKGLDEFYKEFDKFDNSKLPLAIRIAIGLFRYQNFFKATTLTVEELLSQYIKDEKLSGILTDIWKFLGCAPDRLSALYFLVALRGYYFRPTAYIKGGSAHLFKAIIDKIEGNGSRIIYNTFISEIITSDGKNVLGVCTDKGEELRAKVVISNANAIDTLTKLLDNPILKQKYYDKLSKMERSLSAFQVYLGLNVTTAKLGMENFMLSISTTYNQQENYLYSVNENWDNCVLEIVDHSKLDSNLAPPGKSTLTIITFDAYSNWEHLEKAQYQKRKLDLADKLIQRVEKYLPGLKKHIEVMEIATPKTMFRYTLNTDGAIYGFSQTVKQSGMNRLSQETDVKGLLLSGSWTQPGGGVSACFISGIDAADIALKLLK